MHCQCSFNPIRDVEAVNPFGAVDLCNAYASGSLPSNVAATEERFNGIDDPRSIGFRPSDEFELAQANTAIVGYNPPKKNAETA